MGFDCNYPGCRAPHFKLAKDFKKHFYFHVNHRIEELVGGPKTKTCKFCGKSFSDVRGTYFHIAYTHNVINQVADYEGCRSSQERDMARPSVGGVGDGGREEGLSAETAGLAAGGSTGGCGEGEGGRLAKKLTMDIFEGWEVAWEWEDSSSVYRGYTKKP